MRGNTVLSRLIGACGSSGALSLKKKKTYITFQIPMHTMILSLCVHRSFVHVAPCLWNELPYSLRAANSVDTFKTFLKTFLFRKHFSINNVKCFIKFIF